MKTPPVHHPLPAPPLSAYKNNYKKRVGFKATLFLNLKLKLKQNYPGINT